MQDCYFGWNKRYVIKKKIDKIDYRGKLIINKFIMDWELNWWLRFTWSYNLVKYNKSWLPKWINLRRCKIINKIKNKIENKSKQY